MRILVVDDEPAVRHVIERTLLKFDHQVLAAPSANEAAALVLDSWEPIDAAVLDVGLIGLKGTEFGKLLFNLFPNIRLVFITGTPDAPVVQTRPPGSALLAKPFNLSTLLSVLGADPAIGAAAAQSASR